MVSNTSSRWIVAGATFALWAAVAASAAYWGLKLASSGSSSAVAPPPVRMAASADPAALARLLGASPVAAATPVASLSSRFVLLGVVASASHQGAALIAVDGRPARPFRVGTAVDQGLVLQSVDSRRATLANSAGGPAVLTLELPARK